MPKLYDLVLPHGLDAALEGLHASLLRLRESYAGLFTGAGGAPTWIALSEALFWSGAIDVRLGASGSQYWKQRGTDPLGRTAGGLSFARNFHTHELVSLGAAEVKRHEPGDVMSVELRWRLRADLPAVGMPERHGKDLMYDECVAGRLLYEPLDEVAGWFEQFV